MKSNIACRLPFLAVLLLFSLQLMAQQKNIKGRVFSSDKKPLSDVTVTVENSARAVMTDKDGQFSIDLLPAENTLLFTSVGFKPERREIAGNSFFEIILTTDQLGLESVVVVGYGTQRKKDLTGAVGRVSGQTMENNAVTSVGQELQGKIAGVQIVQNNGGPGAGVEIRIRGWGTFGANTNPLIVVDGIITNYGFNDLNPNDIEDVTVLKDASAAAIYGSRGANGVVLVTTRRGKDGKTNIDFSTYHSIDKLIHPIKQVDATTYAKMVNEYYTNAGKPAPFADPASFGKGTNWIDQVFRTGSKQDYALSVSGGNKKNLYAVSMDYYNGEGIVVNSKYSRGNFRVNNDMNPLKGLKLGTSVGLSYGVSKSGDAQGAINMALIYAPTVKPYNADGKYGIANRPGEPTTMTQPLVAAYERNNKEINIRALASAYAEYEIIKGLKFKSSLGIEYFSFDGTYFTPSYNYGLGNTNAIATLGRNTYNNKNWMSDNILTYSVNIAGDHHLDLLAGYTFQDSRYENLYGYREGFSRNTPSQQVLDAGSQKNIANGGYNEWVIQSWLGRLSYSFRGKYLFTSNVRIDQSSRFPSNNRTGVFPSFSAGWVISEEDFLKSRPGPVSFLKLRAGYGQLGNQDIGNYPYQSSISSGLYYNFGTSPVITPGSAPTSMANANIRWEKTATTGAGLEVNFLKDKLRLIVDYYHRKTTDILVQVPIPSLSGVSGFPYQNAASVVNKGFEFTIEYGNLNQKKDFTYNAGFNITLNRNRVTSLDKNSEIVYWDARTTQGHEIVEFYGYVQDGIFQNADEIAKSPKQPNAAPGDMKFGDLNHDGVIDEKDRTYIGSNMAQKVFGFNGTARYKGFDLVVSLNGDLGRSRVIESPGFALTRGAEQTAAMYYGRWTGEGTSNYVPRLVAGDPNSNSRMSDFWIRKQDYLRLKNIQLGYSLPAGILGKTALRNLRIYVAAQNLFTVTNYPGFDPELWTEIYPLPKSYYAGLNIGF